MSIFYSFFEHRSTPNLPPGDDPFFFMHSAAGVVLINLKLAIGVRNMEFDQSADLSSRARMMMDYLTKLDWATGWLMSSLEATTAEYTVTADERGQGLCHCGVYGPNVHAIVGIVGQNAFGRALFDGIGVTDGHVNSLSANNWQHVCDVLAEFDAKDIELLDAECEREYQLTCHRLKIPVRNQMAEATGIWSPNLTTDSGLDENLCFVDETGNASHAESGEIENEDAEPILFTRRVVKR